MRARILLPEMAMRMARSEHLVFLDGALDQPAGEEQGAFLAESRVMAVQGDDRRNFAAFTFHGYPLDPTSRTMMKSP